MATAAACGKALRCAALVLSFAAVAGCQGFTRPALSSDEYDLGPPVPVVAAAPAVALRDIDVVAPSWLAGQAMQYRLLYEQPAQRHSYAQSRWVAAPTELLQTVLRRALVSNEASLSGAGCTLRVEVEELIQAFSSAAQSAAVIEVRGSLLAPPNERLVARKRFAATRPAASPDARGGVAATTAAAQALSEEVRAWLQELDRSAGLAQRCGGS